MKVDIFLQVHKHINGHSPGYMSVLLVLNSDINNQNNRNSSLNLVCPHFKHETECWGNGGGGVELTFGVRATRLSNAVPNSLIKEY